MTVVTLEEIGERRRALHDEDDGEFLDPMLAQVIAPKLMDQIERLPRGHRRSARRGRR